MTWAVHARRSSVDGVIRYRLWDMEDERYLTEPLTALDAEQKLFERLAAALRRKAQEAVREAGSTGTSAFERASLDAPWEAESPEIVAELRRVPFGCNWELRGHSLLREDDDEFIVTDPRDDTQYGVITLDQAWKFIAFGETAGLPVLGR